MKKHIGSIDLLRFVFSLVIVIFHAKHFDTAPEGGLFADAGYIAVEFFFLVSGFLMAGTLARKADTPWESLGKETLGFVWNKVRAILLTYAMCVVFSFASTVIQEQYTFKEAVKQFLRAIFDVLLLRASGIGVANVTSATWYLSAMFISMVLLYPLMRKFRENFTCIIAPLIVIFGLGYVSQKFGHLNLQVKEWNVVYPGIIRAVSELSLGAICYALCRKLREVRFTTLSRVLITLAQVVGYAAVIFFTTRLPAKRFDYVLLLILAVCVTLSFSGQGVAADLFQGKFFRFLGRLSLNLYLHHRWVEFYLNWRLPASLGYGKIFAIFLVSVFAVSLLTIALEEGLKWCWRRWGSTVKGWFVKA